jgi:hypothetical protein
MSLSFCMTTFSASLANFTAFILQSRDCSFYVSKQTLAPPLLRLQKHTDVRSYDFAHSPCLWHQPRLANITCAWSWRFCGFNSAIPCSVINIYFSQRVYFLSFIAQNTTKIAPPHACYTSRHLITLNLINSTESWCLRSHTELVKWLRTYENYNLYIENQKTETVAAYFKVYSKRIMNKWIFTSVFKTTLPEYEAELLTNQTRQSMKFLLVFMKCHMFF